MSTPVQAALLGVVQGLTEFLPVSSSAHLILARAFFGWDSDAFGMPFDVACHLGTLAAVILYFHREMALMLGSVPRLFEGFPAIPGPNDRSDREDGARLVWLLVIGTLPAIAVGLLFNGAIEEHLRTPQVAAVTLALGALGFFVAERAGTRTRGASSLTVAEVIWIGSAQALALVPGVSRSGATLTVALLFGLRRPEAARFVFLLSIPAIIGAAASEAPKALRVGLGGGTGTIFAIGIASSAVVGYFAVRYFIRYLANHSLDLFAWYRLALALCVAVWLVR